MSHPRGLIQTHKGWKAMYDQTDVSPAQRERDAQIDELRRILQRPSGWQERGR